MTRITHALLFLTLCSLLSCTTTNKDVELEQALQLAKENRIELEKVLNHYKNDSLKFRAACFLIKNMPFHYALEEYYVSPQSEKYRPDICKFKHKKALTAHCDSLIRHGYQEKQDIVYDIFTIDSSFLTKNIDLAFTVWKKPWAKDVSFEDFCKYILPYRSQNEKISRLREEVMNRFLPLLDSAEIKTPLEACVKLNEHLKSIVKYQNLGFPFYPTIEETYQSGTGRCEGLCNLGAFIMRAVGIPVAIDFTIWSKMSRGHTWCAVLNNGHFISFGPGEDQPGEHEKVLFKERYRKPAKVYRFQFFPLYKEERLSPNKQEFFLNNPLIHDVTNEYFGNTIAFQVPVLENEDRIPNQVYLCVYNYAQWRPLAIGTYENGFCSFKNVVGDNVFIVANIINDKIIRYITAPFHVNDNGYVHSFIPQLNSKQSFTFTKRKAEKIFTLHYWDINRKSFVPISYQKLTDTTQVYEQIPNNSLLWYTWPQKMNKRIFFLEQDSIISY